MAEETIYTIPLRKEMAKAPKYGGATKAVNATREYLIRHCKTEDIILGQELNRELNSRGRKNAPSRIQVKVYKRGEKMVANLIDAPVIQEEEKKKKGIGEKIKEKVTGKKEEKEEKQEKEEAKREEEKKKVLEHPPERAKPKREIKEAAPKGKKAGQQERKKEIFSKTQKPKHEKKK